MVDRKGVDCLSFAQIKQIVAEDRLELLGRSPAGQAQYEQFMRSVVRAHWDSVADYILVQKFGLEEAVNEASGKKKAIVNASADGEPQYRLLRNDFPYNFAADVQHFILWKLHAPLSEGDISNAINQLYDADGGGVVEHTFYINPAALRSVLEIDHAHIILRLRTPAAPDTLDHS